MLWKTRIYDKQREGGEPLTPKVSVVLVAATVAILALGRPVSHAAKLVALGERRIGDAVERGLGGDRGAPAVARGAAFADADEIQSVGHLVWSSGYPEWNKGGCVVEKIRCARWLAPALLVLGSLDKRI